MAVDKSQIIYTLTDEAPLLATAAFLPVIRTFTKPAGIDVQTSDISVAARILGEFSDLLPAAQLVALGALILEASGKGGAGRFDERFILRELVREHCLIGFRGIGADFEQFPILGRRLAHALHGAFERLQRRPAGPPRRQLGRHGLDRHAQLDQVEQPARIIADQRDDEIGKR